MKKVTCWLVFDKILFNKILVIDFILIEFFIYLIESEDD